MWKPHKLYFFLDSVTLIPYNYEIVGDLYIGKYKYTSNLDFRKGGLSSEQITKIIEVLNKILSENNQKIYPRMFDILIKNQHSLIEAIIDEGLLDKPRIGSVGEIIPDCGYKITGEVELSDEEKNEKKKINMFYLLDMYKRYRSDQPNPDCEDYPELNTYYKPKKMNKALDLPYFTEHGLFPAYNRIPSNFGGDGKQTSIFLAVN